MHRTLAFGLILLATAISVVLSARAILHSTRTDGRVAAQAAASACDVDNMVEEISDLVGELAGADSSEAAVHFVWRDPMKPYSPPKAEPPPVVKQYRPAVKKPPKTPLDVMALILDGDPAAVMRLGSESVTVRVGDEIDGGLVTAIDSEGVTVEYPSGPRRCPYISKR